MEEHIYTKDIREKEELFGQEISGIYFCKSIRFFSQNGKKPFYQILLSDKTGDIPAKVTAGKIDESYKDKSVKVTAAVSVYKGKPQLDIFTISIVNLPAEAQSKAQDIKNTLVCGVEYSYAVTAMNRLHAFISSLSPSYAKLLLSIITKEAVRAMASIPGSNQRGFCYNGGLLDKACYLAGLSNAVRTNALPEGAYSQVLPDWDTIISALILACLCEVGKYQPLPSGEENYMTGGCMYLSRILNRLASAQDCDTENIIHCIRVLEFQAPALTMEAEVCLQLKELADTLSVYSYADFIGLKTVNGHDRERK